MKKKTTLQASSEPSPKWMSAKEVAAEYSVSERVVHDWGSKGLVRVLRIGGTKRGTVRFCAESVAAHIIPAR